MVTVLWPRSISSTVSARASEMRQPRRVRILMRSLSLTHAAAFSSRSVSSISRYAFICYHGLGISTVDLDASCYRRFFLRFSEGAFGFEADLEA